MFGYVMANAAELTPEEKARFSAYYCGLCRTLHADHGLGGRLTLTYDMTFLTVLLTALYDADPVADEGRCFIHPLRARARLTSEMTHYAAAMNTCLAYYKLEDDWRDDHSVPAAAGAHLLGGRRTAIEQAWPRQCAAIRSGLEALHRLEAENCQVIDRPAACFGDMLGEIFALREDIWADPLREMGRALGGFIYVMDAWEDLDADLRRGRYNPLAAMRGEPALEAGCLEMLTLLMARCTAAFEGLPIVEDAPLLRNILYSGVWTRYEQIRRKRAGHGKRGQE